MNIFSKVCVCDYWYFVQSRAGLVQHQPRQRGRLEEWGDHQCNQGFKQSSNFNSTLRRLLWRSLWDANEIEYIMFTPAQSGHQPGGADQQAGGAVQGCGGGDALSLCFSRFVMRTSDYHNHHYQDLIPPHFFIVFSQIVLFAPATLQVFPSATRIVSLWGSRLDFRF